MFESTWPDKRTRISFRSPFEKRHISQRSDEEEAGDYLRFPSACNRPDQVCAPAAVHINKKTRARALARVSQDVCALGGASTPSSIYECNNRYNNSRVIKPLKFESCVKIRSRKVSNINGDIKVRLRENQKELWPQFSSTVSVHVFLNTLHFCDVMNVLSYFQYF